MFRKSRLNLDDLDSEERERLYDMFEKSTGLSSISNGQESKAFLKWIDNGQYEKDKWNYPLYYIRYFPSEKSNKNKEFVIIEEEFKINDNKSERIWKHPETNKEYILKEVAHLILGIPIYYVVKSHKFSVPLFLNPENDKLISKGNNSFDYYNKVHSEILSKSLKIHMKKDYSKAKLLILIYLFTFLLVSIPFFPFVFTKYFVK